MGCWNETCAVTNLPIMCNDPIVGIILHKNVSSPFSGYQVLMPPTEGSYDDCGGIEDLDVKEHNATFLRHILTTCPTRKHYTEEEDADSFNEELLQIEDDTKLMERMFQIVDECTYEIKLPGWYSFSSDEQHTLHKVFVHKFAYDNLVNFVDSDYFYNKRPSLEEELKRGRDSFAETIGQCQQSFEVFQGRKSPYDDRFDVRYHCNSDHTVWYWLCNLGCREPMGMISTLPNYTLKKYFGDVINVGGEELTYEELMEANKNPDSELNDRERPMYKLVGNGTTHVGDLIDEMTKYARFDLGMRRLRKQLSITDGTGSQSECLDSYKTLAEETIKHVNGIIERRKADGWYDD